VNIVPLVRTLASVTEHLWELSLLAVWG